MALTNGRSPAVGGSGASVVGVQAAKRNTPPDKAPDENCKIRVATCKRCQRPFRRERLEQKYCCVRCRNAAVQARLRARSGDLRPAKRHLLPPHREAVTFGQKKRAKTKAIFDPLAVNFRGPVIDFLQRGDDLRRRVVAAECWNYPPRYRRPPLNGDDVQLEYHDDGYPKLPAFLDRRKETPTACTAAKVAACVPSVPREA